MSKKKDALTFEVAMTSLEELVQKLEQGQLPLDDSLKAFEEGMALVSFCEKQLEAASGKIEKIMKDSSGKEVAVNVTPEELQDLKGGSR